MLIPELDSFGLGRCRVFGIVISGIVCIADIAYIGTGRCYALFLDFEYTFQSVLISINHNKKESHHE